MHSQLWPWATPGADICRGSSHDILELLNLNGFSNNELERKPDAREQRKRTIGASRFDSAISPLPVLLFGVTTLRVTWNEAWARRKALKSRQRAILVDVEARTPHQRQYFRKFWHFEIPGACTICLATSNFFVCQRPAVILSENQIQGY